MKAISPTEIIGDLENIIPNAIIQAVNELLKKEFRGHSASIKQKDIVSKAIELDSSLTKTIIDKKRYLDFETIFRAAGWNVSYCKPDYTESHFDAYFTFEPKVKLNLK